MVTRYEVIKQLKKKDIQAKCVYSAQLKIKMDTGETTFTTLTKAARTLKKLGNEVESGDQEELKEEWRNADKRKRMAALTIRSKYPFTKTRFAEH